MENLSKHTPIELNKMINDAKTEHDSLKAEIVEDTKQIDELTIKINKKLELLDGVEKKYIALIEELNNR